MSATMTFHRDELARAASTLVAFDLAVLMHLALRAAPATGLTWTTTRRLAEDLAMPESLIASALERILGEGFAEQAPTGSGLARFVDLSAILVRPGGLPPNLPFEPTPV